MGNQHTLFIFKKTCGVIGLAYLLALGLHESNEGVEIGFTPVAYVIAPIGLVSLMGAFFSTPPMLPI